MSDFEELWHNDRNSIITAKKEVNAIQCFQYLRKNMRSYPKNSVFLFITGHHHKGLNKSNIAIVGESDAGLHGSIGSEWECLKKELKKKCENNNCGECDNCVWQFKQFSLERVLVETNDFDNDSDIFKPSETSLDELNAKFNSLRESKSPYVLVYFSCWSHYSPVNTNLQALGLFAVLALKKERSDLTIERVFELDTEQQNYLKMLIDDPMTIKDLIIAGEYHFMKLRFTYREVY